MNNTRKNSLNSVFLSKQCVAGDFPKRIEIEPVSACNLRCVYCPRKYINDLNGFMEFVFFKKLIDEISEFPETTLVLHRRGESLLYPNFIEICQYVAGKFSRIQLATNATLLTDEKAMAIIDAIDFISFSIDIPKVFNKTRLPAKYSDVENKIFRFLELNKGKVQTQVSMVKTAEASSENGEEFKRIWDGKVDRIRIYEEHSDAGKFGSLSRDRGKRLSCVMPFYEMLIYCDGKVGRCNHDWDGEPMGDVNNNSIKEIWRSDIYNNLRAQHKNLEIKDEVCKNCTSWYSQIGEQGTGEIVE